MPFSNLVLKDWFVSMVGSDAVHRLPANPMKGSEDGDVAGTQTLLNMCMNGNLADPHFSSYIYITIIYILLLHSTGKHAVQPSLLIAGSKNVHGSTWRARIGLTR